MSFPLYTGADFEQKDDYQLYLSLKGVNDIFSLPEGATPIHIADERTGAAAAAYQLYTVPANKKLVVRNVSVSLSVVTSGNAILSFKMFDAVAATTNYIHGFNRMGATSTNTGTSQIAEKFDGNFFEVDNGIYITNTLNTGTITTINVMVNIHGFIIDL